MISTTCREECPAGSSVSAGSGPRGPAGGGDCGTAVGLVAALALGFLVSGLVLELGLTLGLGLHDESCLLFPWMSPELAH